jgi:LEA14-like dessication related protein
LKRRAETIFVIFLAATVALLVAYYFEQGPAPSKSTRVDGLTIPNVSIAAIRSISFSNANLLVQFQVDNPTPVSARLVNASYFLYGNGNYLGTGVIAQPFNIPAFSSTFVESSFTTGFVDSARVLFSYVLSNNNHIAREARGNATFSEPLLGLVVVHFDST